MSGAEFASERGLAVGGGWLSVMRRYLLFVAVANLVWEILHLPLYTIWRDGSVGELAFAVVHCTGGDILIALSSLMLVLVLVGSGSWPGRRYVGIAVLTIALGLAYTIFSEWLNIVVRESWAYSELMPVIPLTGTGLSPVAQWIVVPTVGFWWAYRSETMIIHAPGSHVPLRSKHHV
ncbi:hypothetical protein [Inquilinus sp. CAU 1745]|uniref:hypothetical protein n=1 Tax=Inquilinus sp. CAU 1745 TaxID=3140369 RepID=UPI00325BB8B3